jgi:hypothetical protein
MPAKHFPSGSHKIRYFIGLSFDWISSWGTKIQLAKWAWICISISIYIQLGCICMYVHPHYGIGSPCYKILWTLGLYVRYWSVVAFGVRWKSTIPKQGMANCHNFAIRGFKIEHLEIEGISHLKFRLPTPTTVRWTPYSWLGNRHNGSAVSAYRMPNQMFRNASLAYKNTDPLWVWLAHFNCAHVQLNFSFD